MARVEEAMLAAVRVMEATMGGGKEEAKAEALEAATVVATVVVAKEVAATAVEGRVRTGSLRARRRLRLPRRRRWLAGSRSRRWSCRCPRSVPRWIDRSRGRMRRRPR